MKANEERLLLKILKRLPLRKLILFESHGDFCDNSRELFEYMISIGLNKKYKMIWFVENKEAFSEKKILNVKFIQMIPKTIFEKMMYHLYISSAAYAFYSHRTPPYKLDHGEIFVNLWHGSGPKKPASLNMGRNFDYVHCNSDYFMEARIRNFSCKPEQLLPLGNPRNDLLFRNTGAMSKLFDGKFVKTIIWMPTFRVARNGKEEFNHLNAESHGFPIIDTEDRLSEINDLLFRYHVLLVVKPHPMENLSAFELRNKHNIRLLTNQKLEEKGVFLYSLLGESDALITDISSVFTDYLLLNKPIGFTVNDMDDYKTGFNMADPKSIMPGEHINGFLDFKTFITNVLEGIDRYSVQRTITNNLLNFYKDGSYSKRIVEFYQIH